ncbi:DUF461 domain-containing protein [Streptomyces armeniacus]|uniref:DUF461 domain-containing protein n=1 Tax=Streptomyces armeniacus TaxID=83291 RepID=A0A345XW94_9ACTN|nr:DUF461 domain-containing protein [Streptomyces armeniacus]AXK35910.1 DUF461 domain-containing protein [Streptomyces armeniacus]
MSSSLRRGTLAASALALSVAALTACGAGNNAQTLGVQPDNAATSVGDIEVQAVNVITSGEGAGPASVTARIFNAGKKAQTLEQIRINGTSLKVELSPAKGERGKTLRVPAGGELALGGKDNASAVITEGTSALKNGAAQAVTFDFSSTGGVKLRALVVPNTHTDYKPFGPSVRPSEPAETSPSGQPSGEPGGSPSPTDTAGNEGGADEAATEGGANEGAGNEERQPGADESAQPGASGAPEGGAEEPAAGTDGEHAGH